MCAKSKMKNSIILFISISILSVIFMPVDSIAKAKHQIGLVQDREARTKLGACGYWLVGNREEKKVVFYEEVSNKYALINIDGQDISLKQNGVRFRNKKKIGLPISVEYKSHLYRAKLRNLRDISSAREKREGTSRIRSTLDINSTDGWSKSVQIECAFDGGG
jgi:hypothetical protein